MEERRGWGRKNYGKGGAARREGGGWGLRDCKRQREWKPSENPYTWFIPVRLCAVGRSYLLFMRASAAKRPDVKLCGDLIRASHSLAIKLGGSPFAAGEGGVGRRETRLCLRRQETQSLLQTAAPKLLVKYKTICQTRNPRREKKETEGKKNLERWQSNLWSGLFRSPSSAVIYLWEALCCFLLRQQLVRRRRGDSLCKRSLHCQPPPIGRRTSTLSGGGVAVISDINITVINLTSH